MEENEDIRETFDDVLAERLPSLDDLLAKTGVELKDRPFRAAVEFMQCSVLEVEDGQGRHDHPVISTEIVTERWFAALFQSIEEWYRQRHGAAFRARTARALAGFVDHSSTAFELAVPQTVVEPDVSGETVWLRIPSAVLESEDPLSWLTSPPSLDRLAPSERATLTSSVGEVASRLRSIHVSIMGIPDRDLTLNGFLTLTRRHIERAAREAVGKEPKLPAGCWNLHMAVECAFKALIHRRAPPFPRTHDLKWLLERASSHLRAFPFLEFATLPDYREAIQRRYGKGQYVSLDDYWVLYFSALRVVDSVLQPLVRIHLG